MFENLAYIAIVDRHAGRYPNNGGEYGYSRRLWNQGDGTWEVEHHAMAEMQNQYCHKYGVWQYCSDCPERDEFGECRAEYATLTDAEIAELTDRFPSGGGTDLDGRLFGIIDVTGHENKSCRYEGGCIECYPCGHVSCHES